MMFSETQKYALVSEKATIRETMVQIDNLGHQIALIVDDDNKLTAIATDGDIRRGLLKGLEMSAPIAFVMRTDFVFVTQDKDTDNVHKIMNESAVHHVPVLDENGRFVKLLTVDDFAGIPLHKNTVVLMAGGLGTRLRPLTNDMPKPMIPVGGRPILEQIVRQFVLQGFAKFTIAVNFKSKIIIEHFGDGSSFGAEISYIKETDRLGTAGALSLFETPPTEPFIVMNADLLTTTDLSALLRFHEESDAIATMCAHEYSTQIPYGVINIRDGNFSGIIEKPTIKKWISSGIYTLMPEVLNHLEKDNYLDMPDLLNQLAKREQNVSVFPVSGHWIDIGKLEDLETARADFDQIFNIS